jgi:hypothetical protein
LVKTCPRCGETRPIADFHRWHLRDGRQVYCKPRRKEYDAAYYARTKHRRRPYKEKHAEFRRWYEELKSRPCADCARTFPPHVMHWDHLPGTIKLADVCDLARKHNGRKILAEIEKCELVCANCHAMRTARRHSRAA